MKQFTRGKNILSLFLDFLSLYQNPIQGNCHFCRGTCSPGRTSSYGTTFIHLSYRSVAEIPKIEMLSMYEMLVLKIDHAILKIDSCQTTQLSEYISKDGRVTAQIDRDY